MESFDVFRLDGHTLRVFLTVYETGSVSRAAEIFELNQSTISHTIDKMRAAVGDPLFVKSGRGITPTEKSMEIIPQVQRILAGIEGLMTVGDYDATKEMTPITIGVPTPALMPQMKAAYKVIRNTAPNIRFRVSRMAPRERMTEMLTLGEVDVAIAINTTKLHATLDSVRYGRDNFVVYYDPTCRGPIKDSDEYAKAKHGVAGLGGKTKSVVEIALEQMGLQRQISFVSPTASTLGQFIAGTDMIATMPLGLAQESYSFLAFCTPPMQLPEIVYDLVWHRRFEHSGRNAWIRKVLLETSLENVH